MTTILPSSFLLMKVEWSGVGWMGHWALKRFPLFLLSSLPSSPYLAGGSVSYTSRVMHLYCGIVVVVVIVHRHKLRGDWQLQLAEKKGRQREGGWYQLRLTLWLCWYLYDLGDNLAQGRKGVLFFVCPTSLWQAWHLPPFIRVRIFNCIQFGF